MVNVAHSTLALLEVHEPKGIAGASAGEVYVADGAGSGSWAGVGTSSFTGAIADFAWPVVQEGWLECDGSIISSATYPTLYAVMSIASSGTRTNGSPVISSIPSTVGMKAGYYVFGAGIASGTTILNVDSASQITLTGNASSSGTSSFDVSPFLLNTGTIKLPDISTAGRFRRSRTPLMHVGQVQADQNKAHTHGIVGTSGTESANHFHNVAGTTSQDSPDHSHAYSLGVNSPNQTGGGSFPAEAGVVTSASSGGASTRHTHTFNVNSGTESSLHSHSINFTSASEGGTEGRPLAIVLMTCIKT
jgi:hypothetical protein